MVSLKMHIGRADFVLRVLLITVLSCAFEFLFSRDTASHLNILPRYLQAFEGTIVFGFLGVYFVKALNGRLLDAGLSRWYSFPAFIIWLLSISMLIIWPRIWLIGLALIALLLLVGGSIPSRQVTVTSVSLGSVAEKGEEDIASKPAPPKLRRVGPISFLRSLLTIACLWFPLILLDVSSVQGTGVWIARLGYFMLGVIWLTKLLGRLEDADRLSTSWLGYFVVAAVLLIRVIRRIGGMGQPSQLYDFFISSDATRVAFSWMPWLKFVNGYEMLALFLLIQIPLAFFPSKPDDKLASPQKTESKYGKLLAERRRTRKRFLVAPFAFLRRLSVLAFLWAALIYLDGVSDGGTGTWIARFGYFILAYAWLMNSQGRFEDGGLPHDWYGAQYCLVVSVVSLMPLAVHWVNSYGALAIFVLIQVPLLFLKSKRRNQDPMPGAPALTSQ